MRRLRSTGCLSAALRRPAIIIAGCMLHSRPNPRLCGPSRLWHFRSFGLLVALAATRIVLADEALCPSQTANQQPTHLAEAKPSAGGPIDITSDKATVGVNGNAVLQGNVE